jgi:putative NADH-flavin reductase
LAEGDRTGVYRVGGEDLLMSGDKPAGISVTDLAIAIADEIEHPAHLRAHFTVASRV